MLVGYVSDENYVAIAGVEFGFERDGASLTATSHASGAVFADITPGDWRVTRLNMWT